jgi:hypothetical protein
MAQTREYKDTVLARIKRDPKFAKALDAEAANELREVRVCDEGKPRLSHAEVKKHYGVK